MQKLIRLLTDQPNRPVVEKWNLCREYLQLIILRSLYASPAGMRLVFQGGTCLRICYGTRRYSENLDFSLLPRSGKFSLALALAPIKRDLQRRGFAAEIQAQADKTVQKAFVKISGLVEEFKLPYPRQQKLSVKLEVDTRPPAFGTLETYFVSRLDEIFPIQKYDLPTLFAGKMLAVLFRPYSRGRDYFDLVWFLQKKVPGNFKYFSAGAAQHSSRQKWPNWQAVLEAVRGKALSVSVKRLIEDLRPFLEDPDDLQWLKNYPQVFTQLLRQYSDQ